MQSIGDIIQTIARQRGRGDSQPLLATLTVESATGERIAHLPIDIELAQAWVALTAEPFRPHQAQALTALRRGEPVALRAASADTTLTLQLLLYATLTAAPGAIALVLAPDESAAQAFWAQLAQINQDLPRAMQLSTLLLGANRRPDRDARVIIATPETLHHRLLRHHDRAWQAFWSRLQLVAIPDLQRYAGVPAAQLADLLMRLQRVAAGHNHGQVPNIVATLHSLDDPEPALTALLGIPWRVIASDDGPRQPTMLAVWRGGSAWLRDAADLAAALQRQGYQSHIACQPFERALLAPIIGDLPRVTFGPDLAPGQVLVAAGYPGSHSAIGRMLRAGYQAVVLVLGEQPHEQALARHAPALLKEPPTRWAPPPVNAFVLAKNVLCAASEQPLTLAEVEAWGVQDIVDHLVAQGQLIDLPDPEIAWKPTDAAGDPYAEWGLRSSSGAALIARTEQAQPIGLVEAAVYERWAFPNAALPIGASGFRILARDDETGAITLRFDSSGRRTYPLRRCSVKVREARETRVLAGGRPIGWGRVVVDEEIYGYREATSGGAPAELALKPPLTTRWTAPACWFDLATPIQVLGQFVGWSLAAALPLRVLAEFADVVPCYDHEARRLYLVDAQSGGNGLAAWAYANAEDLLPLAYDVALACRNDPLLEPLSRIDMDWLLTLLGRQLAEEPPERQHAAPRPEPAVSRPEPAAPRPEPAAPRPEPAAPRPEPTLPRPEPTLPRPEPAAPRPEPALPRPEPAAPRPEPPRQIEYIAGPPPAPPELPEPAPSLPAGQRPMPLWDDLAEEPPAARPAPAARVEPPAPARPEPARRPPAEPAPRPERREPPRAQPSPPAPRAPQPGGREPPARASEPAKPAAPRPEPAKPAAPPTPPAARADDGPPDAAALIERLRRQRQQREAQLGLASQRSDRKLAAAPEQPAERRFSAGERIFCLPYGDGVVRASRIDDGRELLIVAFPDHGELTIDPLVSLVRKIEDAPPEDDDLL